MPPRIELIIIASGEAGNDLAALLTSLRPQLEPGGPVSVRVVTNQCSASTVQSLEAFPWIECTDFHDNYGYGGAINRAYFSMKTRPTWVVACNSDLIFPDGSIAALLATIARVDPDAACVAPLLLDPPELGGGIQPSVGHFPTLASLVAGRMRPRKTRKYRATPRTACDVDWATGACLALRAEAFEELGGFDDAMFLDYEETDLCKRLFDAGWRVRFDPTWSVVHSSPNAQRPADPARQVHTRSSLVRYLAKHRPRWEVLVMSLLLRSTLAMRGSKHPFAPSWRAGLDTHRQLRERPTP